MESKIIQAFKQLNRSANKQRSQTSDYLNTINRQEILFQSYNLEKRGKTFGSVQYRKLIIQNKKIYQESSKQKKQLGIPKNLIIETKNEGKKWNQDFKNYPVRMVMQFQDRSPCFVYFKNLIECTQIKTFIISLKFKQQLLMKASLKFQKKVTEKILNNITQMIQNADKIQIQQKKRQSILKLLETNHMQNPINNFFETWLNKSQKQQRNLILKSFKIKYKTIKLPLALKTSSITIKISCMGKYFYQQKCTSGQTQNFTNLNPAITPNLIFQNFSNTFVEINSCTFKDEVFIQLLEGNRKWKTQKLCLYDLWKLNKNTLNIIITSSHPFPSIIIQFLFDDDFKINNQDNIDFTPQNYSLIDQLIGCQLSDKPAVQYQLYKKNVERVNNAHIDQFTPFRLKKYLQGLQIQDLINKCYANQPFKKMNVSKTKGTYIYRYYAGRSQNLRYTDVQKFLWKYNNFQYRRLFNVFKNFDENPRIIFAQNLFLFILRIIELVQKQPKTLYWNHDLFQDNIIGRQSFVFFICLVMLHKTLSNFFLFQSKGVMHNSLLFHYICKNYQKQIYSKFILMQFNIESYFGIHAASILAELFEGDMYFKILDAILMQCRLKKYEYNLVIIGVFLVLLDRVNRFESVFQNGQNFKMGLKFCAKTIQEPFQFLYSVDQYIQKIKRQLVNQKYSQIRIQMDNFYRQVAQNSVQVNQLTSQFYTIFSSYQYRDQSKPHQLHFCLNKIQINQQCPKITFYLYQNKAKLFQKQFINCAIRQLNFTVILKLQSLDDIIIGIYQDQKLYTQFTTLNLRSFPSNHIFQHALPLQRSKSSLLDQKCSYLCFQTFIKDQTTQNMFYVNKIPQKYISYFFDTLELKQDIISLDKIASSFKMVENNYNLLYSRLGWYNNYYIVPDQRLLEVYRIQPRNQIARLDKSELDKIYKVNSYCRCVYGRVYFQNKKYDVFSKCIKNTISTNNTFRKINAQKNKNLFVTNQCLNIYALQTIDTKYKSYFEFYNRIIDLPLLKYLTYNPKKSGLLEDLVFQFRLQSQKSTVILTVDGQSFLIFNQDRIQQIQNSITFRKLKLMKNQYCLKYPDKSLSTDNFLYYLRLNIFNLIIKQQPQDLKNLSRWPNRILIRPNSGNFTVQNISFERLISIMLQTKIQMILELKQIGKQRLKYYRNFGFINYYNGWRRIQIICQINGLYKYYLVQEQITRKKLILKQDKVIIVVDVKNRIKISCNQEDLTDKNSPLYKKIQKLA